MIILLKSFFRSRVVKIYLILSIIMLLTITFLINFMLYFSNIVVNTYQENSYFMSKNDIYDDLFKNEYIFNLSKVILFEYDDNKDIFSHTDVNWYDLLDSNNNYIVGFYDKSIIGDNFVLEVSSNLNDKYDELSRFKGKTFSFKTSGDSISLKLDQIEKSNFSKILISESKYNSLVNECKYFAYIFDIVNYENIDEFEKQLVSDMNIVDIRFVKSYGSEGKFNSVDELKDVILLLKFGSLFFILFLIFLYLFMIRNMILDELKKMKLEKILGYNKSKIKQIIIYKFSLLSIIIVLLSLVIYCIFVALIKYNFSVNGDIFNIAVLLILGIIQFFVFVFLTILIIFIKNN